MSVVTKSPVDIFRESGERAAETLTLWSAAQQSIIRQLVDLSAAATNEGLKLYGELQTSAIAAVREAQEAALTKPVDVQEIAKDPFGWYQKRVLENVDGAQQAFKRVESVALSVTGAAERMQFATEQAGKQIQATFTSLGSQIKNVYVAA